MGNLILLTLLLVDLIQKLEGFISMFHNLSNLFNFFMKISEVLIPAFFTLIGALIGAIMIERNRKKEIAYNEKIRTDEYNQAFMSILSVFEHDLSNVNKLLQLLKENKQDDLQVLKKVLLDSNIKFPTLERSSYLKYFYNHPDLLNSVLKVETYYNRLKIHFNISMLEATISEIELTLNKIHNIKIK